MIKKLKILKIFSLTFMITGLAMLLLSFFSEEITKTFFLAVCIFFIMMSNILFLIHETQVDKELKRLEKKFYR